ncbi:rRNA maturation RNase YbeY [Candidatus Falkowbacteria bacterium]|nr:rRNA maturation RNase YbeY [Candidatus Falkowbacteria bacterium]
MIEIRNLTRSIIDQCFFQKVGKIVLKKLGQSENFEVSLVFVGDARMRALNKKYRGIDKTTDVLSFFYGGEGPGDMLGEIVISIPQAKKQAKKQSYPLKRELLALFAHGILHLSGYEDETKRGYEKMMRKQEELLESLSF